MQAATSEENWIDADDMCIKREGIEHANPVIRGDCLLISYYFYAIHKTCLMQHGALWLSSRSRGINHIGQIFRLGKADRFTIDIQVKVFDKDNPRPAFVK